MIDRTVRRIRKIYPLMANQCMHLLAAYAFYRILETEQLRHGLDHETQNKFWKLDLKKAQKVFYNIANLHDKIVIQMYRHCGDDVPDSFLADSLENGIYKHFREEFSKAKGEEYEVTMNSHTFYRCWYEKLQAIGSEGLRELNEKSGGEICDLAQAFIDNLGPSFDLAEEEYLKEQEKYDFQLTLVKRYFESWLENGFYDGDVVMDFIKDMPKTTPDILPEEERLGSDDSEGGATFI